MSNVKGKASLNTLADKLLHWKVMTLGDTMAV